MQLVLKINIKHKTVLLFLLVINRWYLIVIHITVTDAKQWHNPLFKTKNYNSLKLPNVKPYDLRHFFQKPSEIQTHSLPIQHIFREFKKIQGKYKIYFCNMYVCTAVSLWLI